jgi:hypothetical protein
MPKPKRRWRVLVTRNVTESVVVEVEAPGRKAANLAALDKAVAERGSLPWERDEGNDYREIYLGDDDAEEITDAQTE